MCGRECVGCDCCVCGCGGCGDEDDDEYDDNDEENDGDNDDVWAGSRACGASDSSIRLHMSVFVLKNIRGILLDCCKA